MNEDPFLVATLFEDYPPSRAIFQLRLAKLLACFNGRRSQSHLVKLQRPHTTSPQKVAFRKGNPLISGKSAVGEIL